MFAKYGPEGEKKNKITSDDKLRVAGILLTDEDMKKCVTSMVGTERGSDKRANIDATPGLALAGFRGLFTRFVDKDVLITLPASWTKEETKQSIDERSGEGTYDRYCVFNPNNLRRIVLPWTEKEIKLVFLKMLAEYQAVMDLYTKGTGGGPGAPENYANWMHCPDDCIQGYVQQPCNFYLAIVHIWDKKSKWRLTSEKA